MLQNKKYNKINNLTGWIVFLIAATTYILTMEKAGSLWDCGEFASAAYHLGNAHPPGNPFFILLGRTFAILFGSFMPVIQAINLMSAMASAFTILFLFWTITYFTKRLLVKENASELTPQTTLQIMSAGIIGALAYTFSDTFWYSAVEAEVYALSSFFTALTFWAMTKWDLATLHNDKRADKWIIVIAFTLGLAVGVHLLNLLTIPAMVMVYYFRKYTPSRKGIIIALLIGCIITGLVQKGAIQWSVQLMAYFDIWFVNSLNLPFYSGMIFCTLIYIMICIFLLRVARKKRSSMLRLGVWCFIFMMFGYSAYVTTVIRANAMPYVNMYAVNNPATLVNYLNREQYGDFPLMYGPIFSSKPIDSKSKGKTYTKWKDKYIIEQEKFEYVFAPEDQMFLPRIWDYTNSQDHIAHYRMWLNLDENETPTYLDNIKWFLAYQWNWMYWRYFMWNFAGKQNDVQNVDGNIMHGNWISGIPFIDHLRLGDQSTLPESLKENNKAYNRLYFLPLLLGILGLLIQFKRKKNDFIVTFLFFFFTGIAIILYLNQPGNQPRERDYAFAGSFYVFAIWIGVGVVQIQEWFRRIIQSTSTANIVGAVFCLIAVPTLMAQQEWDDHDRGNKTLTLDLGTNYLESCPPNALLITYGDNDTYPLWYTQEVEGKRRDVRAINSSLLGASWYINQLNYKVNDSEPFKLAFSLDNIVGSQNDIVYINPYPEFNPNEYYDLNLILKSVIDDKNPKFAAEMSDGSTVTVLPTRKFYILVNKDLAIKNKSIHPSETIVDTIFLEIPKEKRYIYKNDLAILGIIAVNDWSRPITFTSPEFINTYKLDPYARKNGMVTELLPVKDPFGYNTQWTTDIINNKMSFTSSKNQNIYYDEENRRHLVSMRMMFLELASTYLQEGKTSEALATIKKSLKVIPETALPFASSDRSMYQTYIGINMMNVVMACGDTILANHLQQRISKELQQGKKFFNKNQNRLSGTLQYMKQTYERFTTAGD
ncbi:MAG: glycosyltransferase family 117 protein [Chitinophagaceae bacterium]